MVLDGRHLSIAPREATLLETLLCRAGHVVPKKILEDQLYGLSEFLIEYRAP